MGLISGLVGLPLAPVRGVLWAAEHVLDQAEEEYYDPARISAQLREVQLLREQGAITDDEAVAREDELVERLIVARDRVRGGP
jgi:hypothetical protein